MCFIPVYAVVQHFVTKFVDNIWLAQMGSGTSFWCTKISFVNRIWVFGHLQIFTFICKRNSVLLKYLMIPFPKVLSENGASTTYQSSIRFKTAHANKFSGRCVFVWPTTYQSSIRFKTAHASKFSGRCVFVWPNYC